MKKFLLLMCMLCAVCGAHAVKVTVDDLMKWGGYCIENTKSDRTIQEVKWLSSSAETRFEKYTDDRYIVLTNMFEDEDSYIFCLGTGFTPTSQGTVSTEGDQLIITNENRSYKWASTLIPTTYNQSSNTYTHNTGNYIIGEITEMENGGYKIVFPSFRREKGPERYDHDRDMAYNYDYYELELFKPNAMISDGPIEDIDDEGYFYEIYESRQYPARIEFTGENDGRFSIIGWNQLGYTISEDNELVPLMGTLYNNNVVELDYQHMVFSEECIDWYNYSGYYVYDRYGNPLYWVDTYGTDKDGSRILGYQYTHSTWSWSNYRLYKLEPEYDGYYVNFNYLEGHEGIYTPEQFNHMGTNRWVTNDGDCTSAVSYEMNFDLYQFASAPEENSYGEILWTPFVSGTKIEVEEDLTHQVKLELKNYEATESAIYVEANITPIENFDHVESWDLYLVDGNHNSVLCEHFTGNLHHEHGHKNAKPVVANSAIRNVRSFNGERAARESNVYSVKQLVPAAQLPGGSVNLDDKYTFFVRANYADGTHTFHDMQYPDESITTGMDLITDFGAFANVFSENGGIRVSGYEGNVEVYSLDGKLTFSGMPADGFIEAASGAYIVRTGTKSAKVIVR